jgi:hypothetical protein
MSNDNISEQLTQIIKAQEKQERIILEFTEQFIDFSQKILSLQERVVKLEELNTYNKTQECENICVKLKPLVDYIELEKISVTFYLIPIGISVVVSMFTAIMVVHFLS